MAERIRFHLDEHVDPAIAIAVRRAGIDVTTTSEAGLRTKDDETHLDFARAEGRGDRNSRSRLSAYVPSRP